jgi:hypothetical protein
LAQTAGLAKAAKSATAEPGEACATRKTLPPVIDLHGPVFYCQYIHIQARMMDEWP